MNSNLFFKHNQLQHIGKNVIIGKTVRIRYPELVTIGDNVIIDDFTYISTALHIENNIHISAGCKLIGGRTASIKIGEFSTLAPNVVLAAGSDDYISGIASPLVPIEYKGNVEIGSIIIRRHCIIGANSTVLPNVTLYDGAAIGAQSLVKDDVKEWTLQGGIPAKYLKNRNRNEILCLEEKLKDHGK